jgi:multiple sugar transport system substrate-binding protein
MQDHQPDNHPRDDRRLSRRDVLRAGLALPFGATLLAACGGSSGGGSKTTATALGAKTDFNGTTIRVITRGGMSDKDVWKAAKADWERKTGGKVVFQVLGDLPDFNPKYAGYIASQDGTVDVLYTYGGFTGQYGDKLFEDIGSSLKDRAAFIPATVEQMTVNDKLVGVPVHSEMLFFQWNKKMFQEAGLDPDKAPATWDELIASAQRLRKGNRYGFASPITGATRGLVFFQIIYNSTKGKVLSDDFRSIGFDNPDGLKTFQTIQSGFTSGLFDPNAAKETDDYVTAKLFNNGESASQLNFAELWADASDPKQSKIADSVGASITPGLTAGTSGSLNGFEGYAVNKFGKQKDAAFSFIQEMASAPIQKAMTLSKVLPSSRTAVLEDPEVTKDYAIGPVLAKQGTYNLSRVSPPYLNDLFPVFDDTINKMAKGQMSAQDAFDTTVKKAKKVIDQYYNS